MISQISIVSKEPEPEVYASRYAIQWPQGINNNEELNQQNPEKVLELATDLKQIQNYILKSIRAVLLPVYIIKFASLFICMGNVKFKDYIFLGKLIMIIKIILFIVSFNTWLVSLKIGTKYIKHCFFTIITIELLPIVKFNPFFIQDDRKEAIGNSEIDHVCSC